MKSLEERGDGVTKTKFVKAVIIIITTITIMKIITNIIIIIIVVIIIMNITQLEILQPTIHWCPVTTSWEGKPIKIPSFLHISSTFLSILAEPKSANFWMRAVTTSKLFIIRSLFAYEFAF